MFALSAVADVAVAADDLPIRGQIKAAAEAILSTDVPLRIADLPFREGQRFEAGDLLVAFDCRRLEAERRAMLGALREAEINATSASTLSKFRAIGSNDVEIAQARLEKARGEIGVLDARLADCNVHAPFAGRVADSPLRVLEFTTPQRPYMRIVGDAAYEIEMIVSSNALPQIRRGQRISFRVDELGEQLIAAHVILVGSVVDPVSKTARIVAAISSPPEGLAVGMSGTATLAQATAGR